MSNLKKTKFYLVLTLLSLSCLSSCATANYNTCPTYPIAGPKVADEISSLEGDAFWEWLARINKLRQQLELCNQ